MIAKALNRKNYLVKRNLIGGEIEEIKWNIHVFIYIILVCNHLYNVNVWRKQFSLWMSYFIIFSCSLLLGTVNKLPQVSK